MPRARRAAGSFPRAAWIRARTRASRSSASWRRRSAPPAPRSWPSIPDWLSYDLPPELLGKALGGRFRGQRQRWFALRFTGEEADIRLDLDPHPEFDAWRWARLEELPALAVGFKRAIYEVLARDFARFATPAPR